MQDIIALRIIAVIGRGAVEYDARNIRVFIRFLEHTLSADQPRIIRGITTDICDFARDDACDVGEVDVAKVTLNLSRTRTISY